MPNPPSQIYKMISLSISSRLTKFYQTNHSRINMIIILVIPIKLINQIMSIGRLLKIKNTLLPITPNTTQNNISNNSKDAGNNGNSNSNSKCQRST